MSEDAQNTNAQNAWDKYPAALPKETILAGRYIIQDVLGQGGFGITYLAEDYQGKNRVAIKEFFPESMVMRRPSGLDVKTYTDERSEYYRFGVQSFIEEAKVLAQLRGNPHIVDVYGYFEENNTVYFVMEFIKGTDFKTYIKEQGGKLGWEETWRIMEPVMEALQAAHQKGIVHRDVAPDNIIITEDNTVKLIDFGAARYSLGERSQSLDVVLKPGYTPKEQYIRRGKQGPYTDVYSVAACFYAALSGYLPPESLERMEEDNLVPLSTRGVRLPPEAERAILQGLEVRAEDRFQSMEAFQRAFRVGWVGPAPDPGPGPVPPEPPEPPKPPVPPSRKFNIKRFVVAAVCAVFIGCIGGTVVFFLSGRSGSDGAEDVVVIDDDKQDTYRKSDTYTEEKHSETAESESGMPEPVLMGNSHLAFGDSYQEPDSMQSDEESESYYVDAVGAVLDVLCKDDVARYAELGIGTADEAHQLYKEFLDIILVEMLSEDIYDQYGELYREYLESALAKADYTVTGAVKRGETCEITVQYRQLRYFETLETEYYAWYRALIQEWLDDSEELPSDEEDMTEWVLTMLYYGMEDALESAQYGKKVSAVVDLESDGEDGLASLFLEGLFDTEKIEPFAEQDESGYTIRGYDDMHYLYVWDDGDAYLGEWKDGVQNGQGIYVWSSGAVYAGSWKDGKRNGYGVNIYADGSRYDGNWKDNEQID